MDAVHWRKEWQATPVFLPRELHGQYEKAKSMTPEDEAPRSEGVQYIPGKKRMVIPNRSIRNKEAGTKWKQHSAVDVSGIENKVQC